MESETIPEGEKSIELTSQNNPLDEGGGPSPPEQSTPMKITTIFDPIASVPVIATPAQSDDGDEDGDIDNGVVDDPSSSATTTREGLPMSLRILFALNGFSLAFPTTALMYVVNTRVEMSLTLLPTYGAIAFLPNSLRPLYACLSRTPFRDYHLAILLMTSAISIALTALVPEDGIILCFVLAFLRGVTSSWPEFLLGLTLVDLARVAQPPPRRHNDFTTTCAVFQAQAATCRSIGSLVASVGALWMVTHHGTLDAGLTNALLFIAASANILGMGVALRYRVGRQPEQSDVSGGQNNMTAQPNYQSISTDDVESGETLMNFPRNSIYNCIASHNIRLVVLLQITVVLLALKQPLEKVLSPSGWHELTLASAMALALSLVAAVWSGRWGRPQKIGLFLILRHVTPSVGYLMSSYFYDIFQLTPSLLQLLSLTGMVISTGATWTYGKCWAKFSSDTSLPYLIVGLTILASLLSLMQVWLVHVLPGLSETPLVQFGLVLVVTGIVDWTGMWNFMPDVVLATTSVKDVADGNRVQGSPASVSTGSTDHDMHDSFEQEIIEIDGNEETAQQRHKRNMQYGTLISCIDFGDQLGALVLGAMVAGFGVSRETEWERLDDLIQVCGILGAFSAVLVLILI